MRSTAPISNTPAAPIKIGASLPLTGEFSEPGKAAQEGYKVWESMTNAKGGLLDGRKVSIDIKDDASSQNTVVSDYTSLISHSASHVAYGAHLGGFVGGLVIAVLAPLRPRGARLRH